MMIHNKLHAENTSLPIYSLALSVINGELRNYKHDRCLISLMVSVAVKHHVYLPLHTESTYLRTHGHFQ